MKKTVATVHAVVVFHLSETATLPSQAPSIAGGRFLLNQPMSHLEISPSSKSLAWSLLNLRQ